MTVADSARTVLVADDSAVVHAVLGKFLRAAGFEVLEVASLREAREVDPSLLSLLFAAVLDLDLGDGTGIDAARLLTASRPSLPFAFFTSGDDEPLTTEARTLGPVFIKPQECDRVVAWLEGL